MPTVTCILVNWNNWQDTVACLSSLAKQTVPAHAVVVDNASSNDSVAQLRDYGADVIEAGANLGFAKACNLAARQTTADYLWFVNNDTVVPPDTLSRLLACPANIAGAELHYFHDPAKIQAWGGGTTSRWTGYSRHFLSPESFGPESYLTFACVLMKRSLFEQLGGLYEGAFLYFEDSDFCFRARAAGATLGVAVGTAVLHKEGGSQAGPSLQLTRVFTAAGLHFMQRHCPVPLVGMTLFFASRVAKRLLGFRFREAAAVWGGVREYLRHPATPSK